MTRLPLDVGLAWANAVTPGTVVAFPAGFGPHERDVLAVDGGRSVLL